MKICEPKVKWRTIAKNWAKKEILQKRKEEKKEEKITFTSTHEHIQQMLSRSLCLHSSLAQTVCGRLALACNCLCEWPKCALRSWHISWQLLGR